jgi:hypothetical protein
MDIVMVHMTKIFILYIGIIAAILEHAYDHCHGRVSGHVYIYSNPMGHTLKSFTSIEYEFSIRSMREGHSESGSGKSRNSSIISRLVPKGSKTLLVIYRKVSEEIRSNQSIYGKSRMDRKGLDGSGWVWKVMEGLGKYRDDRGCLRKFGGFHNWCIHVALRGKVGFGKGGRFVAGFLSWKPTETYRNFGAVIRLKRIYNF